MIDDDALVMLADVTQLATKIDRSTPDNYRDDRTGGLIALARMEEAARVLADARQALQDRIGDAVGHLPGDRRKTSRVWRETIQGVGTFERRAKANPPKCVDEHGLWRAVLDTRVVDEETGEILPPAEVIRKVYGVESKETGEVRLTGASPAKLEAVGIPAKDFFERVPRTGWSIRRIG